MKKRQSTRILSALLAALLLAGCFVTAFAEEEGQWQEPELPAEEDPILPEGTDPIPEDPEIPTDPVNPPDTPPVDPGETPDTPIDPPEQPIIPPAPPVQPDPIPTPEPSPEPEPPRELTEEEQKALELTWPAEATPYNLAEAYSESRERMVQLAIDEAAREDHVVINAEDGASALNIYTDWFVKTYPNDVGTYDAGGWSTIFIMWLVNYAGLEEQSRFPVAAVGSDLEFGLMIDGQRVIPIDSFRRTAPARYTFRTGDLVFIPVYEEAELEEGEPEGSEDEAPAIPAVLGKRVGIVTRVDDESIDIVSGDIDGYVGTLTILQSDILDGYSLAGATVIKYNYTTTVDIIFRFLIQEMDFNEAAACGILANILAESRFSPLCNGDEGHSIGLFQWQGMRRDALNYFCKVNNLDPTLLQSQLIYFRYEMMTNYPKTYECCRNVENSAEGARSAASIFCINYEAPAHRWWNGKQRGMTAAEIIWPMFSYRAYY